MLQYRQTFQEMTDPGGHTISHRLTFPIGAAVALGPAFRGAAIVANALVGLPNPESLAFDAAGIEDSRWHRCVEGLNECARGYEICKLALAEASSVLLEAGSAQCTIADGWLHSC